MQNIRRELGYFTQSIDSNKAIELIKHLKTLDDSGARPIPDFGKYDDEVIIKKGISCVGAVIYIQNLNIRYVSGSPKQLVIEVTKHLRQPDKVEALTLQHEGGCWEVACNLIGGGIYFLNYNTIMILPNPSLFSPITDYTDCRSCCRRSVGEGRTEEQTIRYRDRVHLLDWSLWERVDYDAAW